MPLKWKKTWYDCFQHELREGDDVIIAEERNGELGLKSGIIHNICDDWVTVSYNHWEPDGQEITGLHYVTKEGYPDRVAKIIYKINN